MKKLLLLLAIVLPLSALLAQSAPPFWDEIKAFKKEDSARRIAGAPILFVGSSSFRLWPDIKKDFAGYPVLNRGFGGSSLKDLIRYAYDIILPYAPKQVVIYCGENDLAAGDSTTPEEVLMRFRTLFGIIRTNLPETRISFVSIKPSPSRAHLRRAMTAANGSIAAFLSVQGNADYIDIFPLMLTPDGRDREELFVADRLHMKPEGYVLWHKAILPYLLK